MLSVDSYAASSLVRSSFHYDSTHDIGVGTTRNLLQQRADDSDDHHHNDAAHSNAETSSLVSSSFHPRQHDNNNSNITTPQDLRSLWLMESSFLSDLEFS